MKSIASIEIARICARQDSLLEASRETAQRLWDRLGDMTRERDKLLVSEEQLREELEEVREELEASEERYDAMRDLWRDRGECINKLLRSQSEDRR